MLLSLLAAAQLVPARAAQAAMASAASAQGLAASARSVNPGGTLTVNNVALAGNSQPATLRLTRINLRSSDAKILIYPRSGAPIVQAPPNTR